MNVKPAFAALLLGGNLFAQTPADSVTIQGTVSDFNGNPVDSCTVMWKSPSFRNVIQVMTDPKGHYSARIPKGKYQSVAACRMDVYLHTAKAEVPDEDRKLEFWAWDFIAIAIRRSISGFIAWKYMGCACSVFRAVCPLTKFMCVL